LSYEGIDQFLCVNGHLYNYDAHDRPSRSDYKCEACGEGLHSHNSIETTNGISREDYRRKKWPNHYVKLIKTDILKCNDCGKSREVDVYSLPDREPYCEKFPSKHDEYYDSGTLHTTVAVRLNIQHQNAVCKTCSQTL
jgi:hypothetical protein